MDAREYLERERTLPENALALEQIEPLFWELKKETKRLFESKGEVWGAIVALEGRNLGSPETAQPRIHIGIRGTVASRPDYEEYCCPAWCKAAKRGDYPRWTH